MGVLDRHGTFSPSRRLGPRPSSPEVAVPKTYTSRSRVWILFRDETCAVSSLGPWADARTRLREPVSSPSLALFALPAGAAALAPVFFLVCVSHVRLGPSQRVG